MVNWLRLPERLEVATLDEYSAFCESLLDLGASLQEIVPRALMHAFTRGCGELQREVDAEVYQADDELWNALDGPVFHCSMLAEVCCADMCDWRRIADEPYDVEEAGPLSLR